MVCADVALVIFLHSKARLGPALTSTSRRGKDRSLCAHREYTSQRSIPYIYWMKNNAMIMYVLYLARATKCKAVESMPGKVILSVIISVCKLVCLQLYPPPCTAFIIHAILPRLHTCNTSLTSLLGKIKLLKLPFYNICFCFYSNLGMKEIVVPKVQLFEYIKFDKYIFHLHVALFY